MLRAAMTLPIPVAALHGADPADDTATTLDLLPVGAAAVIVAVDWDALAPEEARRLAALGLDRGARVEMQHRGLFGGGDPIALVIGRMVVALRRAHARAMRVVRVQA